MFNYAMSHSETKMCQKIKARFLSMAHEVLHKLTLTRLTCLLSFPHPPPQFLRQNLIYVAQAGLELSLPTSAS
jgi:hypothetical protein